MIFCPMPLLVFFFAVAMGVNNRKAQNNQAANRKDDDNGLILPDLADKCGYVRVHGNIQFCFFSAWLPKRRTSNFTDAAGISNGVNTPYDLSDRLALAGDLS
jgi:hypothetical protein